ncbi:Alpha/Beta hydrolase protein [Schizophyllum fasciatum]
MSAPPIHDERTLDVGGGRVLAYSHNGDPGSSTVLIFFHGMFGVGDAESVPCVVRERGIHYVLPTLPGMGSSSPVPSSAHYANTLAHDISALLNHLHPSSPNLRLYIAGGSFGCVPAQMLYGAPYAAFPQGRQIAGSLLISGLSPFRHHREHTKGMTLLNYIAVGPPSILLPFRLVPRLSSLFVQRKLRTQASAEALMRQLLFDKMDADEKQMLHAYAAANGETEADIQARMAANARRSVARTWAGYLEISDVLHGDWGFDPRALDAEHAGKPMYVVASAQDDLGPEMARWMVENYQGAKFRELPGGHLAGMYYLDELFRELLDL